jgi:hypothetical protein
MAWLDREGNTLLLGEYNGIPQFGAPQFGDFALPPLPAGNYSACLAKVDASGAPLWLRALAVSSLNGGVIQRMAALTEAGEIVAGFEGCPSDPQFPNTNIIPNMKCATLLAPTQRSADPDAAGPRWIAACANAACLPVLRQT